MTGTEPTNRYIPRSLDELMRDSRDKIARLRRQYGNPADFDHHIRQQLEAFLTEGHGYDKTTVRFVLRVMLDT